MQLLALLRQVDPDGFMMVLSGRHAVIVSARAEHPFTEPKNPDDVPNGARLYALDKAYGWNVSVGPATRSEGETTGMPYQGGISHPFGETLRTAKEMHAALYVAWQSHAFRADLACGWDVK